MKRVRDLADLLDVSEKTLRYFLYKNQHQNYKTFSLSKRSGGQRQIHAPKTGLKILQRKLNQVLLAVYRRRSPVHGFVRSRSVRSNAERHIGAQWLINVDLKDFFSSINFGRVQGMFAKKPYNLPLDVASALAQLCCFDKTLPAGAPSSPTVANMVCAQLDSQLKLLARKNGCVYTRYADDITFSTRGRRFSPEIAVNGASKGKWGLGAEVLDVFTQNGFSLNHAKTRIRSKDTTLEVTGVRINAGLNVKKRFYKEIRAMLHAWEVYGELDAQSRFWEIHDRKQRVVELPAFRAVLRGKIEYFGFIRGRDNPLYLKLLSRLFALQQGLHAKPIWVQPDSGSAVRSKAVWLLRNHDESSQGTAFAVSQHHLVTAFHCVQELMFASHPDTPDAKFLSTVIWHDADKDIAILTIEPRLHVTLKVAQSNQLEILDPVVLLGFPNHHLGDGVAVRRGQITQERAYFGIPHYVIDADIVKGNSGGPVLNSKNEVVGVAVKGIDTPGAFGDNDQLSSFLPITSSLVADALTHATAT